MPQESRSSENQIWEDFLSCSAESIAPSRSEIFLTCPLPQKTVSAPEPKKKKFVSLAELSQNHSADSFRKFTFSGEGSATNWHRLLEKIPKWVIPSCLKRLVQLLLSCCFTWEVSFMNKWLNIFAVSLFCVAAQANTYTCKFIVGWPAGSGDSTSYTIDTLGSPFDQTYENYEFLLTKLPVSAGSQIQLRIVDPYGGMSTTDIDDGYNNPFLTSRTDAQQSAAQMKCQLNAD
jgi:hypothetical protein